MLRNVSRLTALLLLAGPAAAQPAAGTRPPPEVSLTSAPSAASPFVPGVPPPIHLAPVVPPALKLLTHPSVQTEIALNGRQTVTVQNLTRAWDITPRIWEPGTLFLISPEMGRAAVMQRTKEFFDTGLTKEQRTRLDQIVFQLREREFGAYAAFAMAARDLRLRPDQVEDVSNLKGLRIEEIARHVTSGERYAKIKDRVATTNGETFEKMTEMLTKGQRERLKEMRGKVFGGKVDWSVTAEKPKAAAVDEVPGPKVELPKPNPPMREFRLLLSAYPPSLFGVYDLELRYLATPELRAELKVTAEQGRKLDSALEDWSKAHLALPGLNLDRAGRLHEQTAKAINEILKPDQRKRLDEIMMRRRLLISPEAMCGHPGAVAALKLTPIQLKGLQDGKSLSEVLTKSQAAAVKELPGEPFSIPKGVVDPLLSFDSPESVPPQPHVDTNAGAAVRIGVPPAYARSFLVISNVLKLSDKQIARLRELAEDEPKIMELIQKELDFADTPPVLGAGRSLTSANAVTDRFKAAIEEQCWNVLDAQQQSTARRIFGVKR
jgi:hypothetical protein